MAPPSNIHHFNKNLAEGIVEAAKIAKVPKYEHRLAKKNKEDEILETMIQKQLKLNTDIQNPKMLKTDLVTKTKELHEVNKKFY